MGLRPAARAALRSGWAGWAALLAACGAQSAGATLRPMDEAGLLIRNRSSDIVCEVRVAPAGTPIRYDRLEPTDVIPPGSARRLELEGPTDLQLVDCNGDVILQREGVQGGERGVMLTFEARE